MEQIGILCEEIVARTKHIHSSAERIAVMNNQNTHTALLLDEIVLDDYEVLQSLVIALGEILLPLERADDDKEKEGEPSG